MDKYVGAVENAVLILRHLAQAAGPLGVAAIARDNNINVSTAFNILRTLSKERLVVFDSKSKTYRIGLGMLEFSAPLLGINQADLLHPELEQLSEEHDALICLWKVTPSDRIVLVDRVVGANVVRIDMKMGSRLPAFVGAVGRCVASTRELSRKALFKHFKALRWQAPPTFDEYAESVQMAARENYAFDLGQLFRGVDIAASVVRDHGGDARFGISGITIAGQMPSAELQALAIAIRESAERVSGNLYGFTRAGTGNSDGRMGSGRRGKKSAATQTDKV